eukprot:1142940-Pelagomonas_calceolata.AAC.2
MTPPHPRFRGDTHLQAQETKARAGMVRQGSDTPLAIAIDVDGGSDSSRGTELQEFNALSKAAGHGTKDGLSIDVPDKQLNRQQTSGLFNANSSVGLQICFQATVYSGAPGVWRFVMWA